MRLGRRRRGRLGLPLCAALTALLVAAPAAQATFHEILVREVKAGGVANDSYVVLQAYRAGQQFVGGHSLTAYDAGGATIGTFTFSGGVANGQNQMTILVADTAYASSFPSGPAPDKTDEGFNLNPAGGAVCWADLDCVAWGGFSGALPSPAGTPAAAAGIPAGTALRRTIAPGCATLLEASDDHDNSAADFSAETPAPRSNAIAPTEQSCAGGGGTGAPARPGGRPGAGPRRPPCVASRRNDRATAPRPSASGPTRRERSSSAASTNEPSAPANPPTRPNRSPPAPTYSRSAPATPRASPTPPPPPTRSRSCRAAKPR